MKKTVLIVDDDPKQMLLAQDLFEISGCAIILAADGAEGVEWAKKYKPDLILMDIMMPEMDGYVACREIKADETTNKIPIIMLTSLDKDLDKGIGKYMGANEFISKPLDLKKVKHMIDKYLPSR